MGQVRKRVQQRLEHGVVVGLSVEVRGGTGGALVAS